MDLVYFLSRVYFAPYFYQHVNSILKESRLKLEEETTAKGICMEKTKRNAEELTFFLILFFLTRVIDIVL